MHKKRELTKTEDFASRLAEVADLLLTPPTNAARVDFLLGQSAPRYLKTIDEVDLAIRVGAMSDLERELKSFTHELRFPSDED